MPGLIMDDVIVRFSINSSDFGLLTSMYYWGYAGMQIPVALLLDRQRPSLVLGACTLSIALSTLLFVWTENWAIALLARFITGAGSAAAFLGVSKIISEWFNHEKYSWYIGLSFSFGLLGAVYGGKPVALLIDGHGWENAFTYIAFFGVVIAFMIFFFLKSPACPTAHEKNDLSEMSKIIKNPMLWILSISNLLMVGPLEGFADVWGISYLMKEFSLTKPDAAHISSFIFVGMIFGGPILSFIAKLIKSEKITIIGAGFLLGLIFIIVLTNVIPMNFWILQGCMVLAGILCCYQVLVFSVGTKMVSANQQGVTVAFLNCINMLGGIVYHNLIGLFMDVFWQGTVESTTRIYDVSTYAKALMVIPIGCLIGALGITFMRQRKKLLS